MKRILAIALALALIGPAAAQNITRSLQGSQDPRGPVGIDTSNSAYFPGHINAFGQFTKTPSQAAGPATNGLVAGSTDAAGQLQIFGATSTTLLFGSPFNAAPNCVATPSTTPTSGVSFGLATATTSMSITGGVSGTTYNYICIGNQ